MVGRVPAIDPSNGECQLGLRSRASPSQDLPSGLAGPESGSTANISICSGWLAATMGPLRQPSQPRTRASERSRAGLAPILEKADMS